MSSSWHPARRQRRQIHKNEVSFSMLRRSMFIPKLHLSTIARHYKCIPRKLYEVQD